MDFGYEIIIGDDYSTDGTREILLDYQQRYPDLITLNLQPDHDEAGIPGRRNNTDNITSATGQYIAFLDGDDYWISTDKLQRQADFMDANPEYTLCICDALMVYENSGKRFLQSSRSPMMHSSTDFSYRSIVKEEMPIIASSAFFRSTCITPLPAWFQDVYLADQFLQLMALQKGPGRYFKDLKIGKIWTSQSVGKKYFSGKMWTKVLKNDQAILAQHFPDQKARPYCYRAQFHMVRTLRYKAKGNYLKMMAALYKVYQYDRSHLAHWLKLATQKGKHPIKKLMYSLVYRCVKNSWQK